MALEMAEAGEEGKKDLHLWVDITDSLSGLS